MSTLKVRGIRHDTATTDAISIDSSNNITLNNDMTVSGQITYNGNVGIGTSSPDFKLSLGNSIANNKLALYEDGTNTYGFGIAGGELRQYAHTGNNLAFGHYNKSTDTFTEAMRIDGSGHVTLRYGLSGQVIWKSDIMYRSENSGVFGCGFHFTNDGIMPVDSTGTFTSGTEDVGIGGYKWRTIYATNGSINTSDINKKQQINALSDSEMAVAKRISALFKTYKWNDSVAEKGDNARIHTGVMAQHLQQAFTDEGLDATKYAMFCSDTVYEVIDEDGKVTDFYTQAEDIPEGIETTSRTELALRYSEVFAFICAYNDQRFTDIESRLTALEGGS